MDARFQPYIEAWIKRLDEQNKEVAKRTEAAQALLPNLVKVLSQEYNAQRVTLVGSLARGDFDLESDIDLVVQGVPENQFFQACAAVNRAAESFWVDVVPYESANSLMRRRQDEEGIVLYAEK